MEDLRKELQRLSKDPIISKKYRNIKLFSYLIRTFIAVVIIYFLWYYEWIKWVLYIYIPINLISLISIFGWNLFLNKRIKKSQLQIEEVISTIDEERGVINPTCPSAS
ncbi:hypothetical protein [Winogradskyella luteola]|uniref:2TM domain-containing protein n=1 Tax=Winogradskyella luteola TaxID=2828330 RepID=A0A9X1FAI1_9FLAO|nr:hypothetical protein [Winogradskyella luteola]MBV7268985.1 hypothetical protein [Winogradskyella luteola]